MIFSIALPSPSPRPAQLPQPNQRAAAAADCRPRVESFSDVRGGMLECRQY